MLELAQFACPLDRVGILFLYNGFVISFIFFCIPIIDVVGTYPCHYRALELWTASKIELFFIKHCLLA